MAYRVATRNMLSIPSIALWVLHTAERNWDEGDAHFPPAGFQITNVSAGTGANNVIPGRFNVSFNIRHGPSLTVEKVESLVKDAMGMAGLSYELAAKSDAMPFLTEEGPFTELCSKAIEEVSACGRILPRVRHLRCQIHRSSLPSSR